MSDSGGLNSSSFGTSNQTKAADDAPSGRFLRIVFTASASLALLVGIVVCARPDVSQWSFSETPEDPSSCLQFVLKRPNEVESSEAENQFGYLCRDERRLPDAGKPENKQLVYPIEVKLSLGRTPRFSTDKLDNSSGMINLDFRELLKKTRKKPISWPIGWPNNEAEEALSSADVSGALEQLYGGDLVVNVQPTLITQHDGHLEVQGLTSALSPITIRFKKDPSTATQEVSSEYVFESIDLTLYCIDITDPKPAACADALEDHPTQVHAIRLSVVFDANGKLIGRLAAMQTYRPYSQGNDRSSGTVLGNGSGTVLGEAPVLHCNKPTDKNQETESLPPLLVFVAFEGAVADNDDENIEQIFSDENQKDIIKKLEVQAAYLLPYRAVEFIQIDWPKEDIEREKLEKWAKKSAEHEEYLGPCESGASSAACIAIDTLRDIARNLGRSNEDPRRYDTALFLLFTDNNQGIWGYARGRAATSPAFPKGPNLAFVSRQFEPEGSIKIKIENEIKNLFSSLRDEIVQLLTMTTKAFLAPAYKASDFFVDGIAPIDEQKNKDAPKDVRRKFDADNTVALAMHEIGHLIGLRHELSFKDLPRHIYAFEGKYYSAFNFAPEFYDPGGLLSERMCVKQDKEDRCGQFPRRFTTLMADGDFPQSSSGGEAVPVFVLNTFGSAHGECGQLLFLSSRAVNSGSQSFPRHPRDFAERQINALRKYSSDACARAPEGPDCSGRFIFAIDEKIQTVSPPPPPPPPPPPTTPGAIELVSCEELFSSADQKIKSMYRAAAFCTGAPAWNVDNLCQDDKCLAAETTGPSADPVRLIAFADPRGDENYNFGLALMRLLYTVKHLRKSGVSGDVTACVAGELATQSPDLVRGFQTSCPKEPPNDQDDPCRRAVYALNTTPVGADSDVGISAPLCLK